MKINSMKRPLKEFANKAGRTAIAVTILTSFAILIFSFVKRNDADPNFLTTKNPGGDPEVKLTVLNSM